MEESDKLILRNGITKGITNETVEFAKKFGHYLAAESSNGKKLTTTQLRKFFGEIKRQQTTGYKESSFVLLKPKLAYAVGRTQDGKCFYKIKDLYDVLAYVIDVVVEEEAKMKDVQSSPFKNFIAIFEAIVAYHKEEEKSINKNI